MNSQSATKPNFNRIAPVYDALAFVVFGRQLRRAQTVFLDQIPPGSSILIVGDGTGWLLQQVLIRGQPKRVVYLDASARMVARASRRMIRGAVLGSVDFRVGDEQILQTNERFDILLTPFLLDVFAEQTLRSRLIPQLRNVLKTDGLWLVTDFVQTGIWWQKILLWSMIRFFRLTAGIEIRQLPNWQQALTETGLVRQKHQRQVGGLVSAEVWTSPARDV